MHALDTGFRHRMAFPLPPQVAGAQAPALQSAIDEEAARRVFPPEIEFRTGGDRVGVGSGRPPTGGAEVVAVTFTPGPQEVEIASGDNRGRLLATLVIESLWPRDAGHAERIVAEFDDGALTKAFGRQGFGVFAGPAILAREIETQFQVARLGSAPDLMEEFYAISIERRISNPAVAAITDAARRELFPRL